MELPLNASTKPMRPLYRRLGWTAASLCVWLSILTYTQDSLILHPGPVPADFQPSLSLSITDWKTEGAYRGKLYEPEGAAKGTILVFHGNAGTVDHRDALARRFYKEGYRVVLQEYPGFGARDGKPSVRAALKASLEDFQVVKSKWPGPLYLVGESFGAGMAAQVAGANPKDISGVLLFTPWESLKNLVNEKFYGVPLGILLHEKLDSADALAGYTGPVVAVAAENDELIPNHHAKALVARHSGAQYLEIREAGHNTWMSTIKDPDWEQVFERLGLRRS